MDLLLFCLFFFFLYNYVSFIKQPRIRGSLTFSEQVASESAWSSVGGYPFLEHIMASLYRWRESIATGRFWSLSRRRLIGVKHHKPYIFIPQRTWLLPLECHDFSYSVYKLMYVKPQTLISTLAKNSALVAPFSKGTYFLRVLRSLKCIILICLNTFPVREGPLFPPPHTHFISVLQYIAHHTVSNITSTSFQELVVIT